MFKHRILYLAVIFSLIISLLPAVSKVYAADTKIAIQAGHWKQVGQTGGTSVCDGTTEVSINLAIAQKVVDILEQHGYSQVVVLSAEGAINNWTIDGYASDYFDVFVAVHLDNVARCDREPIEPGAPAGFKVAGPTSNLVDALWSEYEKSTGFVRDPGHITIDMTGYYAFNYLSSRTKKAIIEMGWLSNEKELHFMNSEDGQQRMANGIVNAIESLFKTDSATATDIPNPDNYSCLQPGYVDFEDFSEGTNLSSGTIAGMQFTTTNGYSWLVGDFDTGNYNGKYPNGGYTSQGTHWAWLGITQGAGRIDFPKGPASYFSLLVSNNTLVSVDAYSASGEKLATAGPAQSNYYTGHMTELKITRATADMAYVMVHDQGNFFVVDGVCTDAPGTPNTINRIVDETYFMQTGERVTGNFFINFISGFWRYLRIFIGPFFSDVDLLLTRPDGTIVNPGDPDVTFNKTENYIEVIIEGANSGQWNYEIIANELEPGGENIRIIVDEQLIVSGSDNNDADTTGVFRPSNGALYLKNQNTTGFADIQINYGLAGDYPVVGDWNGNGTDTIGVYRNGVFYLRNSNTIGYADVVFAFGSPGDQPIAGDWNGDGIDTIGVYRSSTGTFFLRNSNSTGVPDMIFALGIPGDVGIAGDWNNDGFVTTGVFRPSNGALYLKNTNTTGFADIQINYGLPGDKPVTGDWDNDGTDTIGVYRNGTFYLRNSNTIGYADIVFDLGVPGDMPITGNWDGLP